MQIFLNIIYIIVGFVLLIKGADFFVESSASIAKKLRIPTLIIGLTLVAFGTSLPELAVSVTSALSASSEGLSADIAMGNIVGSNVANITLILGASALMMPLIVHRNIKNRELPFLLAISIIFFLFALFFQVDQAIVWWEALILLLLFIGFIIMMIKTESEEEIVDKIHIISNKRAILLLIIGIAGVSLGGVLVTNAAEFLSLQVLTDIFGVASTDAKTLVGLSIVALGTSLPELVTSMVAAGKNEADIAIGNVIGSNVFNSLLVAGFAGIITPLGLNANVIIDMGIVIGLTIIVFIFVRTKKQLSKREGAVMLGFYIMYITYIILRAFSIL